MVRSTLLQLRLSGRHKWTGRNLKQYVNTTLIFCYISSISIESGSLGANVKQQEIKLGYLPASGARIRSAIRHVTSDKIRKSQNLGRTSKSPRVAQEQPRGTGSSPRGSPEASSSSKSSFLRNSKCIILTHSGRLLAPLGLPKTHWTSPLGPPGDLQVPQGTFSHGAKHSSSTSPLRWATSGQNAT